MKNKIKKIPETFDEEYIVSFRCTNPATGFMETKQLNYFVPVKWGVNEKNNHNLAKQMCLRDYPKADIFRITYV